MSLIKRCTVTALLVSVLAGCSSSLQSKGKITNYEAPGNLAPSNNTGCLSPTQLKNTVTPPDLYNSMVQCIKSGRDREAAYLFALAGTYTTYDAMRVSDGTARQAHSILAMKAREASDPKEYDRFFEFVKNTLGNSSKLPQVCSDINLIGAPNYQPKYMIQHGINTFLGSSTGNGMVKNFDSSSSWKKSLNKYLHCANV